MTQMKECFGQLANMSISFRSTSKQHYLRVDEDKYKECDTCPLLVKCMFLKYNELIRDLLRLVDSANPQDTKPRLR